MATELGGIAQMNAESFDASEAVDAADIGCPEPDQTEAARKSTPPMDVSRSWQQPRSSQADRRKPSLKSFLYGALNPRRRSIRRDTDNDHAYLDWHPTHLIVVSTTILALSVIDGLLTIYLVQNGVTGFVPLSAISVDNGAILFALVKFVVTAGVVVGLVLTAHMKIYRFMKASTVLYLFLCVYLVLVINQGMLASDMF